MTLRSRTRALAGTVALVLAMVLAGCTGTDRRAAGVDESRGQVERTESMDALDLVLVTNGKGVARLIGTLVNQADQPDRLVGLDVDTEPAGHSVVVADAPYVLEQDEPFRLYRDGNVTVYADAFAPGYRADLTLVFARSVPITTTVPVKRNTGVYRDIEVTSPPDGDIRPGA
jgi:hypothetical protein